MRYELACDSCGFNTTVEAEGQAYTRARDHEADHPDHFVNIREQ